MAKMQKTTTKTTTAKTLKAASVKDTAQNDAANALQNCLKICWDTRHHCQQTLAQHCLPKGGAHAADAHVEAMIDCIEICQVAADFLTRKSPMHTSVCAAAANICDAAADSCETFVDDKEMLHCAEICRACAKACRTTGQEDISGMVVPTLEMPEEDELSAEKVAAKKAMQAELAATELPAIDKEFNIA